MATRMYLLLEVLRNGPATYIAILSNGAPTLYCFHFCYTFLTVIMFCCFVWLQKQTVWKVYQNINHSNPQHTRLTKSTTYTYLGKDILTKSLNKLINKIRPTLKKTDKYENSGIYIIKCAACDKKYNGQRVWKI